MRKYSFEDELGSVTTLSEEDIHRDYYPSWLRVMWNQIGKDHIDENIFCFENCLKDWIELYQAQEVER
jgi:hypothetical protein